MKINIKNMLDEKNNEGTPKNEENSKETIPTEKIENSEVQEQKKEEAKKVPKLGISTLQNKNHSKIEEEKKEFEKETKNEAIEKKEILKSEEESGQSEPEVKKPKININMNNKNIQREAVTEKKEEPTDQEKFEELKKQSEINNKNEDDEDLEKFQNEFFSDEKKEEPKKENNEELFSNYVSGYDQKLEKYEEKEIIKLTKKVKTLMRVMYSFIFVGLIFGIGLTNYLIYDFSKDQESDLNSELIADNQEKNQQSDNSNQDDPWGFGIDELTPDGTDDEENEDNELLADNGDSNSGTGETDNNGGGTINNQDLTREEINQIVRENLESKIKNLLDR